MDNIAAASKRAVWITRQIRKRADVVVGKKIASLNYGIKDYVGSLENLGIPSDAWEYIINEGIDPKLVFAHPLILQEYPQASLYYRGMAALPYKRVAKIVTSVKSWEQEYYAKTPDRSACERVAVLYNTIISTIILDSDGWTRENGYRNILATMGITHDGAWNNMLGQIGERQVRESLVGWLITHKLIQFEVVKEGREYLLGSEPDVIRMRFSTEPDVLFEKWSEGELKVISTIEIKSGTDPAGARERLGAIRKSFENTPAQSKNFLVLGVTTPSMREGLKDIRITKWFYMQEVVDGSGQRDFINEIFHYTLRLLDKPWDGQA